jgi:16S rRNA (guanine527-N7)-methyltransferase
MPSKSAMDSTRTGSFQHELDVLTQGLNDLHIPFTERTIGFFRKYLEILHEYQSRIHLISKNDYQAISARHFLPSVLAYHYLGNRFRACDIGAGAGFPSVPLKIVKPDIRLTLFESVTKKARFLEALVEALDLPYVQVLNERAEYYTGERFDLVLLRAVGRIRDLVSTVNRVLAEDGIAIFYKTHEVAEEITAAQKKLQHMKLVVRVEKLHTPVTYKPLALVIITRTRMP